jgi:hypothetical protein
MANSSEWGQGANNNNVGWGQGAFNNSVGWGASHYVSWSGETDIVGNEGGLVSNFSARVTTDGGTYEANSCLLTTLEILDAIS